MLPSLAETEPLQEQPIMPTRHPSARIAAAALALAATLAAGHAQAQTPPRFTIETLPRLGSNSGSA